jgi:hypothetical protein
VPSDICKQLEVPLRSSGSGEGAYVNTTCNPSTVDPGGCTCFFDRSETFGGGGTFRLMSSNEILHTNAEPSFDHRATFCRQGDSLQLTGTDGSYLFNVPGLRTMDVSIVTAPNCTDGLMGPGEGGVDCGGSCPMACPP